jgi:protocatechuate 3,4-dioxygenase, alpha subunit
MSGITLSASQTLGPFFHDGMLRADARRTQLVAPDTVGERICIAGHVYDGDGLGVPDAMLEIWQANHYGRYNHPADRRDLPLDPAFHGFGRDATDAAGSYGFETIKQARPCAVRRPVAPGTAYLHRRIRARAAQSPVDTPVLRR